MLVFTEKSQRIINQKKKKEKRKLKEVTSKHRKAVRQKGKCDKCFPKYQQ